MTLESKLMDYALRALGRRSLTESEMQKKLLVRLEKLESKDKNLVTTVMGRLSDLKLINDEQYVRDFIRTSFILRPIGLYGAINKLRRKGVSRELVEKVWEEGSIDEDAAFERAFETFERKKGQVDSPKQKERAIRFLASRGFDGGKIYDKIRSLT